MSEQIDTSGAAKVFGHSVSWVVGAAVGWFTAGSTGIVATAPAVLITLVSGICTLTFSLMCQRYVGVLGAGTMPKGSLERDAYDKLRESLQDDGSLTARLYARWLTGFLDAVDRFFRDAGMADRTLFPHAFGLRSPTPLWTAPAFDRCLLLALVYPIVTIFLIWAISGEVGPAEQALRLRPDVAPRDRGIALALAGFLAFVYWCYQRTAGWKRDLCLAVVFASAIVVTVVDAVTFAVAGALALAIGGAVAGAGAAAVAGAIAFAAAGAAAGVVAVGFTVAVAVAVAGAFAGALAFVAAGATAVAVAGAVAVAVALAVTGSGVVAFAGAFSGSGSVCVAGAFASAGTVMLLNDKSVEAQRRGIFLSIFLLAMIIGCLGAANVLASSITWRLSGPLLLFLGLLTLINAPFDWLSLGLTRALLRRGLERKGWWPLLLALIDAFFAALIVAALSISMVFGVQAFDTLAVLGGGEPILPLKPLFDGIAAHPSAPEYWWVYALLLTTMIPSLINLAIGGASLMRGLPMLPALLLRKLPSDGKTVPSFDRAWIAVVLSLQNMAGVIFGLAAQALIFVVVIVYAMPWLGASLLDMARAIAALNLPMWAWQFFQGIF